MFNDKITIFNQQNIDAKVSEGMFDYAGELLTDSSFAISGDSFQKIEDDYVDFIIPRQATHYSGGNTIGDPNSWDKYEIIVHNLTVKNDSGNNNILRITWYDDGLVQDTVDIHYLFEDSALTKENIKPYSLAKYNESCLDDLKEEVAISISAVEIDDSKCLLKEYEEQAVFNNLTIETGEITGYEINTKIDSNCTPDEKINCEYNVSTPIYSWSDYETITIQNDSIPDKFLAIDDVEISSCVSLASNAEYTLISDISTSGNCFYTTGSNITVNGNGHYIDGNDASGRYCFLLGSDVYNITIKNLETRNYYRSFYVYPNTYDIYIYNNTIISGGGSNAISVSASLGAIIENNTIRDYSGRAMVIKSGTINTRVIGNTINGTIYGIELGYQTEDNNITKNNIQSTTGDIYISHPIGEISLIYNNIFNGTVNFVGAYSSDRGVYNLSSPFEYGNNILGKGLFAGNYWGDGEGSGFSDFCDDLDENGICDTSYSLDSGNIDYYPLSIVPYLAPSIEFVSPTLANNSVISKDNYEWNVTIDTPRLNTLTMRFNETNYYSLASVFGTSIYNFDNRSALHENDTFVADVGIYGLNSTKLTGVNWNASGKYGGAYEFNSLGDIIRIKDENGYLGGINADKNGFTVSTWVRFTGNGFGGFATGRVIGKANLSSGYGLSTFFGTMIFQVNQKNKTSISVSFPLTANRFNVQNEWHQVTGVYNTTALIIYADGVRISEKNFNHTGEYFYVNKANNFTIGSDDETSNLVYNGSIDEVRFSNYYLTDEQVKYNYDTQLTKINNTRYIFTANMSNLEEKDYNYSLTAYDHNVFVSPPQGTENTTGTRVITYVATAGGDIEFTNEFVTPSSPVMYGIDNLYHFNITATNTNNTNLSLTFNNVNYTAGNYSDEYYVEIPSQSNDTYDYYWWGYGSDDGTDLDTEYQYVINPNDTACDVLFNETVAIKTYPWKFKVYTNCLSDFQLYYGVIPIANNSEQDLPAGTHTFSVKRFNTNFSNYYDTEDFVINPTSVSCSLVYTDNQVYPDQVQVNGSCDNPDTDFEMWRKNDGVWEDITAENGTWVTLGADSWDYKINITTDISHGSDSQEYIITVLSSTSACDSLFNSTLYTNYGDKFKSYSNCDSDFVLARSGTTILNNSEQSLGADTWNFVVDRTDTQNYSNVNDAELFTINQIASEINLTMNGTQDNITIFRNNEITINLTIITGDAGANLSIYWNNDLFSYGNNPLGNLTYMDTAGDYNFTGYYIESQNYTANYQEWNVTVLELPDSIPPYFNEIPLNQTLAFDVALDVDINGSDETAFDSYAINWTDTFKINSTGSLQNDTLINPGIYFIEITINDTTNNINTTMINVTVQQPADTTPPWFDEIPLNQTLTHGNDLEVNFNASDNEVFDSFGVNDTQHFSINKTGTLRNKTALQVGVYMINITINDTLNNLNSTIINVTYNKNTPILAGAVTSPITYGTASDYIGSVSNVADTDCSFDLSRNNATIDLGKSVSDVDILGVNTYTYNYSTTGCTNYTYASDFDVLIINKAISEVNLNLNGTSSNLTIYTNGTIDINVTLITGDVGSNVSLYNATDIWNFGVSPIGNKSAFNTSAIINFTAIYPTSQNYTQANETWWLHIEDAGEPSGDLDFPWNFRIIGDPFNYLSLRRDGLLNASSLHIRSNLTMFSEDGSYWLCGPDNSGSFICS